MDERTLEVVIKAENETKAAFAEIQASLAALTAQTAASNAGFLAMAATAMPGGQALGYLILAATALAVVLGPLSVAVVAVAANILAWATIASVALGAIGALTAGVFLLGAANAGGLTPATEMVKAHHALQTAIKNHSKALEELKLAQQGVDIYELGKGSKAENVRLATAYVTATTANLADAQHDYREPASGLGGPIANLGSAIDDMVHHFEQASRPLAEHIALWVTRFLPAIEKAGDAIFKWFGERTPAIFASLTAVMGNMSAFFGSVFGTIGRTIDYVLAHAAEFDAFWKGFLGFAAGAFNGIMNAMMGVADWFRTNWPAISKQAGDTAKAIGEGFSVWMPAVKDALKVIGDDFHDMAAHLNTLQPLWVAFGFVAGGVLTTILGTIDAIISGLRVIEALLGAVEGRGGGTGGVTRGGGHAGVTGPHTTIAGTNLGVTAALARQLR